MRTSLARSSSSVSFAFGGESTLSWRTDFLTADHAEYADFFSCISRGSRLKFGASWPEIFEPMNTSPNQPLEATGVSARDWPWSFRFAPSVLAGASAGRWAAA